MDSPYIVEETDAYAVVFKPAKTHSDILREEFSRTSNHRFGGGTEDVLTIIEWYQNHKGYNKDVRLMHRLDFETNGLVLFAKNEKSYLFFKELQDKGEFVKEYSAICIHPKIESNISNLSLQNGYNLLGFPPFPPCPRVNSSSNNSSLIQSYFRPYGPGRKQVRPIVDIPKKHKEIAKDKGGFYQTEIIDVKDSEENKIFTVRIKRGFRHQIRCHLCWAGFPILNDPLYSNAESPSSDSPLALKSHALFFADPASGQKRECRIAALE